MEEINYGLEEMHKVQTDLLKRFAAVCEERGFTWFLAFGSLLGAAREHRIIPWDDSIDVVMPYPDYEKLTGLPQEAWGKDLFLQTCSTDPQYPKCYAKLRNSATTLIKADYVELDINQGIYINIMPLIRLADDPEKRRRQIRDAKLCKALTEKKPVSDDDVMLRFCASFLLSLTSDRQKAKKRDELMVKIVSYENGKTADCFVLAGNASLNLALPAEWFASSADWVFEDMTVKIPKGWHEWLTLRYGDYTVEPISDLQGDKISNFVTLNTRKPYTEYKGKTYCVKNAQDGAGK